MGQYFRPVIINAAGEPISALNPRDYGAGDKIANHSRIGTPLMTAVEALLSLDGVARLVWAGDYDEPTPGEPGIYWLTEPHHLVRFAGLVDADTEPNTQLPAQRDGRYTCNPDKHQYIDNAELPRDPDGAQRTPLPWLTAEAGFTNRPHWSWARDRIYLSTEHPGAEWKPIIR